MSESIRNPATKRPQPRTRRASDAWKSALMASGVGGVILGWALLTQVDAPKSAQAQAAAPEAVATQTPIPAPTRRNDDQLSLRGQAPSSGNNSGSALGGQTQPNLQSQNSRSRQAIPQQPRFQRPLTRSRGS
jgi:hypothetical protein